PDVARRIAGDALAVGGGRLELAAFDRDLGDAPGFHLIQELRILHRRLRRLAGIELVEHGHQHQPDDEPDDQVLKHVVQRLTPVFGECCPASILRGFLETISVSRDSPRAACGLRTLTLPKSCFNRWRTSSNASPWKAF